MAWGLTAQWHVTSGFRSRAAIRFLHPRDRYRYCCSGFTVAREFLHVRIFKSCGLAHISPLYSRKRNQAGRRRGTYISFHGTNTGDMSENTQRFVAARHEFSFLPPKISYAICFERDLSRGEETKMKNYS